MGNTKEGGVPNKKRVAGEDISKKGGTDKSKPSDMGDFKSGGAGDPEKSNDVVEKHPDYEYKRIQYAVDGTHHLLGEEVLNASGAYHGQQKTEIQRNHEHLQSQLTVNPADLALPLGSDAHQKDLLRARKKFNEWNQYIERGDPKGQQKEPPGK